MILAHDYEIGVSKKILVQPQYQQIPALIATYKCISLDFVMIQLI